MLSQEISWLLREKYQGAMTPEFERDCERLATGEPLGYVIGWVPFFNTKIWLPSHPLIPRPETEYWVERAIAEIQSLMSRRNLDNEAPPRVLDLCAGSGCIGTAVAKAFRDARVDFAEIDPRHHLTILKNLAENHIPLEHTKIYGGDLFEKVRDTYDVILSNPPYIDPTRRERVEKNVLDHEPLLALFGGKGGIEIIVQIMREAPTYLRENGVLYIEHEPEQTEIIHVYAKQAGFGAIETLLDQYDRERITRMARTTLPVAQ